MKRLRRTAGIGVLVLAVAPPTPAADLEALMFADRDQVRLDEEFELTIEVRGADAGDAQAPDLFSLKDVQVLGYPAVNSRYQWIDGHASFTKSFRYTVMADKEGEITIPPVTVRVGDREVTTAGLSIRVAAGRSGGGRAGGRQRSEGGMPEIVRARAEVDKAEVFIGEQLTVHFLILTPREIRGLEILQQPEFPGFWVEEIPQDPDGDIRRVRRDGSSFIEYTVMKRALFPGRTGELVIEPVIFSVTIPRGGSDPPDSMFFESRQTLHRRSDRLTVKVKPLPAARRPEDFRGAVGTFRVSVDAHPRQILVNDAVSFQVVVQGNGNLSTLEPPLVEVPPEIRRYDPRITEALTAGEAGVGGRKTWEFVLVPRVAGRHTIPPVRMTFFDPERAEYRTVRSAPVVITAAPGDLAGDAGLEGAGGGEMVERGRDIHFIKTTRSRLRDRSRPLYRHPATVLALLLPAAGNVGLFLFLRHRRQATANRHLIRRRRAWRRARWRLENAERDLAAGPAGVFDFVAGAVTGFVADKFDLPPSSLTGEQVSALLTGAGVPAPLVRELRACLEACDAARFGRDRGAIEPRGLMDRVRRSLARIERHL